jgi:hypothetical protein
LTKTIPSNFPANPAGASRLAARARVSDCYNYAGGALLGWLDDEARKRRHGCAEMARALGVTYGYIHQLKTTRRQVAHISDAFARMCGAYLGVPVIVVKLLAGRVVIEDFLSPGASADEVIERGFRSLLDDPSARELLPLDLHSLTHEARRALVLMYAESTGLDLFNARQLPMLLRYLQQAAIVHDENTQEADWVKEPAVA